MSSTLLVLDKLGDIIVFSDLDLIRIQLHQIVLLDHEHLLAFLVDYTQKATNTSTKISNVESSYLLLILRLFVWMSDELAPAFSALSRCPAASAEVFLSTEISLGRRAESY